MRPTDSDRYHAAFPNPDRPFRWPGEEDHFRAAFQLGDVVRMLPYRALGQITAFNNTWSHVRGGRIVHVEPILAYQTPAPADARPYRHRGCWESDLAAAQPGDVSAHTAGQGPGRRPVPASWEPARPDLGDGGDRRRGGQSHGDGHPLAP